MRRRWITRSLYSAKISCVLLSPTSSSFFAFCIVYQTDTPPYINATHDEMKEYMRLLGKIKYELMNPVSDTYNIIVSLTILSFADYQSYIRCRLFACPLKLLKTISLFGSRTCWNRISAPTAGAGICRHASCQSHHTQ